MSNTQKDNYKEVKNFIHNDLNLTKQDIREMIEKTVQQEVLKKLNDESFLEQVIQREIRYILRNETKSNNWKRLVSLDKFIYDKVCDEVTNMIHEKLSITLRNDEEISQLKEEGNDLTPRPIWDQC